MIDLRIKGLPNSIQSLDGEPILLNTDFRLWIRFYEELERFNNHIIDELDCSYKWEKVTSESRNLQL